jgi:hypothetical protein
MFCNQCRTELQPDNVCPKCGTPVGRPTQPLAVSSQGRLERGRCSLPDPVVRFADDGKRCPRCDPRHGGGGASPGAAAVVYHRRHAFPARGRPNLRRLGTHATPTLGAHRRCNPGHSIFISSTGRDRARHLHALGSAGEQRRNRVRAIGSGQQLAKPPRLLNNSIGMNPLSEY